MKQEKTTLLCVVVLEVLLLLSRYKYAQNEDLKVVYFFKERKRERDEWFALSQLAEPFNYPLYFRSLYLLQSCLLIWGNKISTWLFCWVDSHTKHSFLYPSIPFSYMLLFFALSLIFIFAELFKFAFVFFWSFSFYSFCHFALKHRKRMFALYRVDFN